MDDLILAAILILVLGTATAYIIRAKKRGVKCIGCPSSGTCGQNTTCAACQHCGGNK
ncbi:MAG: FeoB-associated Cys-rich membrane protein [Firmicutes bacterium]|nr:FeoB-associated Cys-rich membrane protein [Bacillota bacterium]